MTSAEHETKEFERRLAGAMHDLGMRAPVPTDDLRPVHRRVAVRARRRNALRGGAMAAVAVIALGGLYLRAGHQGNVDDTASVSAPTVSPAMSLPVASPIPAASADAPDNTAWTTVVGVTSPAWPLVSATSWDDVRSDNAAASARFTVFQRTSTWRSGDRDANGQFMIVQSDVADSPFSPGAVPLPTDTTVTAGTRQTVLRTIGGGLIRAYWSETVKGTRPWTISITALNTDEATLVNAVAGARWNATSELWSLEGSSSGWQRDRWPNTGQPREIELRYQRTSDGVRLDVLATAAGGRFGAALVADHALVAMNDRGDAVNVRGNDGFASRDPASDVWHIVWAEGPDRSYEVIGGAGMALTDVVALLGDVSLASLPTVKGS